MMGLHVETMAQRKKMLCICSQNYFREQKHLCKEKTQIQEYRFFHTAAVAQPGKSLNEMLVTLYDLNFPIK